MLIKSRKRNDCVAVALCNHYGLTYESIDGWLYSRSMNWIVGQGVEPSIVNALIREIHVVLSLPQPSWSWQKYGDTGLAMMRHHQDGGHLASIVRDYVVLEGGEIAPLKDLHEVGWGISRWLTVAPPAHAPVSEITDTSGL